MATEKADQLSAVPRIRITASLGAALYMAAFATLYAAIEDDSLRAQITTLFTTIATISAMGGALWAMGRSERDQRATWVSMTVSMSSFSVGMVYRLADVVRSGTYPAAGSLEDVAFTIGFVALIPAVVLMAQPRQGVVLTHLRQALDLASIALALLAGLALLILLPMRLIGADLGLVASIAFGVYAALSTALVIFLISFKRTPWNSSEAFILAGLVCGSFGVLTIISTLDYYQPASMWSALPNSLLTAAFLFFALSGVHAATRWSVFGRFPTGIVMAPRWMQHVSTTIALFGVPWLIIAATQAQGPFARALLSTIAVILALTVSGRNIVANTENRRLAEQAIHDPLTGLFNARHFHEQVADELGRADAVDSDVTVCELLIDGQDERVRMSGFDQADGLIKSLARRIETVVGLGVASRVGSNRFALVLPSTNAVRAYELCAACARAAGEGGSGSKTTLSIGIASARLTTWDPETLISYAHGAAYWAASAGGNRIVLFDPEVVAATDSRTHIAKLEEQSQTRLLEALAATVDARDPYTRYHSANVTKLAEAFAESLGMAPDRIELIRAAALMHDLGKIGIADSILMKPGGLTAEEYEIIKSHAELGARILSSASSSEIIAWVRSHHERWDGQGYPDGLAGDEIPYEARLLTICDAYDAMTSDRPYRKGMSVGEAHDEVLRCAGTQFDPKLVGPFLEGLFEMWPETSGRGFRVPEAGVSPRQGQRPVL